MRKSGTFFGHMHSLSEAIETGFHCSLESELTVSGQASRQSSKAASKAWTVSSTQAVSLFQQEVFPEH